MDQNLLLYATWKATLIQKAKHLLKIYRLCNELVVTMVIYIANMSNSLMKKKNPRKKPGFNAHGPLLAVRSPRCLKNSISCFFENCTCDLLLRLPASPLHVNCSIPVTKLSLSLSAVLNIASYFALSAAVTTHGVSLDP